MNMPLGFVRDGKKAIINKLMLQEDMNKKLQEMGFFNGAEVQVIKNDGRSVIVSLGGGRLALGKGMANKIMIEEVS
ncbi:FeoA domain-containing protein [Clostridium sp. MSJ-4]|uniref:FeoA domain-containing protein n=1 Tax=Clostridium simiarum TaxID=2841506 RepID=A0ABS6F2Y8_9CLOT|nr:MULTISPECIES: FeoA domain-containing protein [Clostridium]MBU5592265.1 FeoA domain-containing protein [Clostridium simiarum]